MKRVRCPKCSTAITFDETMHDLSRKLVFKCSSCGNQFAVRLKQPDVKDTTETKEKEQELNDSANIVGNIIVIENVFHYKQVLPLRMGDNTIGRNQKGNPITTPIATDDPSMDLLHCTINVSRDKKGKLKYELKDGPSNTGTFVDNEILGDRERRIITNNQMFTIGATSILLKTNEDENDY